MLTKTDLEYIEIKTRELVESVLKTRVGIISICIHTKENIETVCDVTEVRSNPNCGDHDNFQSESASLHVFMPVKEG